MAKSIPRIWQHFGMVLKPEEDKGWDRFSAMVTVLAASVAVSFLDVIGNGDDVRIQLTQEDGSHRIVRGHVADVENGTGLATVQFDDKLLLSTLEPNDPEVAPDVQYLCPAVREDGSAVIAQLRAVGSASGGRVAAEFDSPRGSRIYQGAPIFVENRFAAIVNEVTKGRVLAIPYRALTGGMVRRFFPQAAAITSADAPAPAPRESLTFEMFGPRSLDALNHAEQIRLSLGQRSIHVEALVLGLAMCRDSFVHSIFASIWREGIPQIQDSVLPMPPKLPTVQGLTALPDFSKHTFLALQNAAEIAASHPNPLIRPRDLLRGVLQIPECHVAESLQKSGLRLEIIDWDSRDTQLIAGYSPDLSKGEDRLGIGRDVRVLSSLIAWNDLKPPLSIGLFGNWGSGKTFFMEQMEKELMRSAKEATEQKSEAFCKDIVQIKFNAWHYVDTDNLWASLVTEIFEQLAAKIAKQKTPDEMRAKLMVEAAGLREELKLAEKKRWRRSERSKSRNSRSKKVHHRRSRLHAPLQRP
jgi:hypothetical protein